MHQGPRIIYWYYQGTMYHVLVLYCRNTHVPGTYIYICIRIRYDGKTTYELSWTVEVLSNTKKMCYQTSVEVGKIRLQYRHRLFCQPAISRVHRLPALHQHPPVLDRVARPDERVAPVHQPHREARQRPVAGYAIRVGRTGVPHILALLAPGEGGNFCPGLFDLFSRKHGV